MPRNNWVVAAKRSRDGSYQKEKVGAVLFLLSLLATLIYSHIFSVPFVYDDSGNIEYNTRVHHLANFLDLSGSRYVGLFSFALNYRFGGLDVFGYHLVNLLIHIANGFLVYSLVRLLSRAVGQPSSHWVPLATALLFVVHPVQTQAVTYIVQRFASLVTLFYLLAVVCYLKWRLSPSAVKARFLWYAGALLSCLLAMKTKENSFTLPLMILLVEVVFFRPFDRAQGRPFTGRRWLTLLPFLLMLPIIPYSRGDILGESERFLADITPTTRLEYLFTQFRVIVTYLRLLILPVNQNLDYEYPIYDSLFHPPVFLSFLLLASLLGFALWSLVRPRPSTPSPRRRLAAFGILWFFLALAVESSIIPIRDALVEHRVYLPSVGFFLVASLIAVRGWRRQKKTSLPIAVAGLLIIGGLSVATYRRNLVWADPVALWQDVVKKSPRNARARNNLGHSLTLQGRNEEALQAFQAALTIQPNLPKTHYNIGNIYAAQGRLEEAMAEYQATLRVNPADVEAHNNLGNVYLLQGRLAEATREYRETLRMQPDHPGARKNLENVERMRHDANPVHQ